MKHQVLFSSKEKSKKLKCRLLQFLLGALKVKCLKYKVMKINISALLFSQAICTISCQGHSEMRDRESQLMKFISNYQYLKVKFWTGQRKLFDISLV